MVTSETVKSSISTRQASYITKFANQRACIKESLKAVALVAFKFSISTCAARGAFADVIGASLACEMARLANVISNI